MPTVVRTVASNSDSSEVNVGMHQGSALSPFLFMIVMGAIAREYRDVLTVELLYANNLVVITGEDELIKTRKDGMEKKTKVMISGESRSRVQNTGRWPCGVCGRGVGKNYTVY